jgi:hypothetical protein
MEHKAAAFDFENYDLLDEFPVWQCDFIFANVHFLV